MRGSKFFLIFFLILLASVQFYVISPVNAYPGCISHSGIKECCWDTATAKTEGRQPNRQVNPISFCEAGEGTTGLLCYCGPQTTTNSNQAPSTNSSTSKSPTQTQSDSKPIIFKPSVSIPGTAYTAGQNIPVSGDTGAIAGYIIAIFKYSIGVISIIAAVALMVAGLTWLTSAGNQEKIRSAKIMLSSAISGLVLAFCSFLILSMVNTSLTSFKVTPIANVAQEQVLLMGCCQKENQNGEKHAEALTEKACTQIAPQYKSVKFFSPKEAILIGDACVDLGCCQISSPSGSRYEDTTREDCVAKNPDHPNNINFVADSKATDDHKGCVGVTSTTPTGTNCIQDNTFGCKQNSECCKGFCIKGYSQGNRCEQCIPRGKDRCSSDSDCCPGTRCVYSSHLCM